LFDAVKYVGEAANLDVNWVGKAIFVTSRTDVQFSDALTVFSSWKPNSAKSEVLARVNDVAITNDQVNSVASKRENEIRQNFSGEERERLIAEARKQALNHLINRELLLQAFSSYGATLPEEVVESSIDYTIGAEFSGNRPAFLSDLELKGYSLNAYKEILRAKFRAQAVQNFIVKDAQSMQQWEQKLNEWFASARKKAAITMY
jgi:hypothetical protein